MNQPLRQLLEMTLAQENLNPLFRAGIRLGCLEDAIMLAKPSYLEADENILSPMIAALAKRFEWDGDRDALADVQNAAERLSKALNAAHDIEESVRR